MEEFSLNRTVIMPMDLGSVSTLQSQLSVAGDFNDFSFTYYSVNGISNHFQIKIDPETTTFESPMFDVFPDYIYQFSYHNLLQEQIHAESNLIFTANGVSKTIKLMKGPKDKIFLETDPEIIVVDRDQENILILDLYSYGNFKRNFVLSAAFWNDIIKSSFEPVTIIPGNNTSLRFTIPAEQEPGIYYLLSLFWTRILQPLKKNGIQLYTKKAQILLIFIYRKNQNRLKSKPLLKN